MSLNQVNIKDVTFILDDSASCYGFLGPNHGAGQEVRAYGGLHLNFKFYIQLEHVFHNSSSLERELICFF